MTEIVERSASCDAEEEPILRCWCGLEMRSTLGIPGVYGHVGRRRPGDTHPASTVRPRRRKPKDEVDSRPRRR